MIAYGGGFARSLSAADSGLAILLTNPLRAITAAAKLATMKRPALLVAFVATVTCAPTAAYGYCVGSDETLSNYRPDYYSVANEFGRATVVIEAIVANETWVGEDGKPKPLIAPFGPGKDRPWGLAAPYMGAWYDVQVTRSFKGKASGRLRLFSENSTARFWLNKGQKYVLFVTEEAFDAPIGRAMTIDTCGNSAPLNDTLVQNIERVAAN